MKRAKIRPAVKPPVPSRPKPVRSEALATFPAGAHTVRLLGPTKSCPYYSATFYLPGDRRPQRTTLGTDRRVASEWCRDKADELGRGLWLSHPDRPYQSVRRFVAAFVNPDENVRNWKPRTREKYVELSRLLPEQFLDMECRFLTEEVLQNLVRDYAVGRKHSTTLTYKSFLTNLVSYGRRRDWLLPQQLTRCDLIVPRAHDEEDLDGAVDRDLLPDQDSLDRLVDAFTNKTYRLMIRLVLYTGLRFSEVAALTCTDVDLRTGKIRINKAAVESNTGKIRLSTTKNRERRTVVFARESLPEMTALVEAARQNRDSGGRGLLFPAARGGYLSRNNFGERQWRRAVRATPGLPEGFHFHSLRHCAAVSMLDDRGLNVSTVSATLGHRDVGVTERIYLKGRHGYSDRVAASMGW